MTSINRLPVVDTHHHLWDLSANCYPWLTYRITTRVCGEYSAIRKNYLLEDFFDDADAVNLVKSIHVQAEHDHADPVRETRWLQEIADSPVSRGFPHGIIAFADLSRLDVEADRGFSHDLEMIQGIHHCSCNYRPVRAAFSGQIRIKPLQPPGIFFGQRYRSGPTDFGAPEFKRC